MDRDQLIKRAELMLDDCDLENYPAEAMADFAIEVTQDALKAERKRIAERLNKILRENVIAQGVENDVEAMLKELEAE